MRPEIDYTRQRTVAELLAEHGEAGGPGRRNRRRGDDPVRPPNGPAGVTPRAPGAGPRGVREPGPPPAAPRDPAYRGAPRSGPVPGRRDRPTEMIGDRQPPAGQAGTAGHGPGAARSAAAAAERAAASGPLRAVGPSMRDVPGRAAASGPLRAVPPAGSGGRDGLPAGGRAPAGPGGPQSFRPGPRDTAPAPGRPGAGPWGPAGSASPWEPYRGTPAGGPARPHAVPERPTGAGWEQREPVARPFLPATPPPVSHRPTPGQVRSPAQPGSRPERVPDPGPSTGAYDPFEFDDEDDDGPQTVVGADARAGRSRTPRRDGFPALMDGPATALDLGARRADPAARSRPGDGPATQLDVTALRRGDGPATDLDVTGRPARGDGPATDFDVTAFDVTGRPGPRAVAVDAARPAVLRPAFGAAPRGRSAAAAAPAPPRVRPFAQKVVDGPTQLTDKRLDELDQLDERTDVAPPRRGPTPATPPRDARRRAEEPAADDEPFGLADAPGDGIAGLDGRFDLDDAEQDEHHRTDLDDLDDLDPDDADHVFGDIDDDADPDDERGTRPAQAWAGVVAQWLAGAVAGAVLWVAFRYLWRELPVVALAAAVLVTVGLVLLVRQLLHHVDRRTTGFAVAVGLLLTASPAVLVLLGR